MRNIKRIVVVRVGPKEDLLKSLELFVRRKNINSGLIISGIGSVEKVSLRLPFGIAPQFPITDEHRRVVEYESPGEITNISGNIAVLSSGEVMVHAHLNVALGDHYKGQVVGGHLVYGNIVYNTAEIFLGEVSGVIERVIDPITKMPEILAD